MSINGGMLHTGQNCLQDLPLFYQQQKCRRHRSTGFILQNENKHAGSLFKDFKT